jgi:hypothetical protein
MEFKPLLGAIENVIKLSAANALINTYRHYVIEPGVHSVPVCVLGTTRGLKLEEEFLGDSAGAHPVLWQVTLGISVLTRRYTLPPQVIIAAEAVDALQGAVFTALNDDPKQGDVCAQSWIESVKEVGFLNGEYVGYELILILQKFEA